MGGSPCCAVSLCLASFTRHNVFEAHPYCGMGHRFIPSNGHMISHCVSTRHLLCPVSRGWAFAWLPHFGGCGQCCGQHSRPGVCADAWFRFSGKYLGGELLGHTGTPCNHLGSGRGTFYTNWFRTPAFFYLAALWSHQQPLTGQVTCPSLPQCPHFILRC